MLARIGAASGSREVKLLNRTNVRDIWRRPCAVFAAVSLCGCGHPPHQPPPQTLPPSYIPLPFGRGPAYRPPALGTARARPQLLGGMHCSKSEPAVRYGIHIELFAHSRVIAIPAGIGIAPPLDRRGASVLGGRCSYPLRTREPTGVVEVAPGSHFTLGELFEVWGEPLSRRRLLSFRGRVGAYVAGAAWAADPRSIPLRPHAQITLEVAGSVPPHTVYDFPNGL